ncbi:hypothetical protein SKTS_08090 [Sulfurimicrobium lacus]|uniref:Uncharacterized protein n=1 Tax=Sulfurimicrobium lacus TaxID=2715678 RepID=A0A6F8V7V8_9PROT|nr:hypothetical protein [Sulfurimicrobium lacus]BCB25923.1 hypothetical protein SKTS_08090 [Sulfurimicrobium lacus]
MQANLFTASATGLSPQLKTETRLALTLAIQRICQRATAEGKTRVRPATLRKMERHVSELRKAMRASR